MLITRAVYDDRRTQLEQSLLVASNAGEDGPAARTRVTTRGFCAAVRHTLTTYNPPDVSNEPQLVQLLTHGAGRSAEAGEEPVAGGAGRGEGGRQDRVVCVAAAAVGPPAMASHQQHQHQRRRQRHGGGGAVDAASHILIHSSPIPVLVNHGEPRGGGRRNKRVECEGTAADWAAVADAAAV